MTARTKTLANQPRKPIKLKHIYNSQLKLTSKSYYNKLIRITLSKWYYCTRYMYPKYKNILRNQIGFFRFFVLLYTTLGFCWKKTEESRMWMKNEQKHTINRWIYTWELTVTLQVSSISQSVKFVSIILPKSEAQCIVAAQHPIPRAAKSCGLGRY